MGDKHYKVNCTGVIGAASAPYEIFSFGFALDTFNLPLTNGFMNNIASEVVLYFGGADTGIANKARLRDIAFHSISTAGLQDAPTYHVAADEPGQATATQRPSQVALAVSLRGPAAVHPKRGRWYLPLPVQGLDTDTGLISEATAQAVADATVAFKNAIDVVTGSAAALAIVSKGFSYEVTEIRVGRVLDTLRSRRNEVPESYVVGV